MSIGAAALLCAAALAASAWSAAPESAAVRLEVPAVRQSPQRCGPAALTMVLRYWGASPAALAEAESAWDPAFRGALLTDLAQAARRAGFQADLERSDDAALLAALRAGVPPILLYRRGVGPLNVGHYGVIAGWDPARQEVTVLDGGPKARRVRWPGLRARWRAAGGWALLVRPQAP